jgi:hypothetical protein
VRLPTLEIVTIEICIPGSSPAVRYLQRAAEASVSDAFETDIRPGPADHRVERPVRGRAIAHP